MSQRGYLRHPALFRETIVFVADDDLWQVSTAGGIARRLTAGLSEPSTPAFSPDGQSIAFVGRDEQHPEVYLMPAVGGPARRMTWLGPDVMVRGFTPEGHILFVTTYGQPFFRNYRAYTLDPAGGMPQMLPYGQVNHLAFGPGNAKLIGRNTADPARWKRYRGGTAGHFWIDAPGTGTFRRMTELAGNLTSPMWIAGRIYYLSDAEGVGNLYSCLPDGSDPRRHSDHDDYYARHAQTDGKRIVYQCGADVWLFDPAADRTARIDIEAPSHCTQAARRFVTPAEHLGGIDVHPAGHSLAVDVRGKPFTFALWEGAMRQHGNAAGGRYRHVQWLADGVTTVAIGDASGEERVVAFGQDAERTLPWDVGRVVALRAAPRGSRVALANHRNEVLIGDLDGGTLTVVDRSDSGRTEDLAWSADGAWLAYSFWTSIRHCAIKLHDVANRTSVVVTQPEFRDYCPSFDPDGRYLYFLSIRTFDPVYDSVQFELSFPRAARPYLIALCARRPPAVRSDAQRARRRRCRREAEARGRCASDGGSTRRHRRARRGISGRRRPLRPDRRRCGQQSDLDPVADRRRAWARRAQGVTGTPRGVRFRHAARRNTGGEGRQLCVGRRQRDARRSRGQAVAGDPGEPQTRTGPRSGTRRRRAVAQERLDRPRPDPRVGRPAAGMATDAARSVAVAARPVLGCRHVRRGLGGGLPPL